MARTIGKALFFEDLREHITQHVTVVSETFAPLSDQQLNWQPNPKEWSILQCFDHLNLTHAYYAARIEPALIKRQMVQSDSDDYRPTFLGRIYMHFSFNPRYSFPTVEAITPATSLERAVLAIYLEKQQALTALLGTLDDVDLRKTHVPLEKGVRFNLGDCLKVLVYHDELHIGQAKRVMQAAGM